MKLFLAALFTLCATAVVAAPKTYVINAEQSDIGFRYSIGDNEMRGRFPDFDIDLKIDFAALKSSSVSVNLDATQATAGFIFATQAMRSGKILAVKEFPNITFTSATITGRGDTAELTGDMTVRGVTKPITLNAQLFRPKGTTPDQLDNLIMKITGTINRFDFGASGYPDEVGPDLTIDITAAIKID